MSATHTFQAAAVMTSSFAASPEELLAGHGLTSLLYCEAGWQPSGFTKDWSKVGTATITVTLISKDEMIGAKVEALQAELAADLAASEVRQSGMREMIQNLLAITNEAAS